MRRRAQRRLLRLRRRLLRYLRTTHAWAATCAMRVDVHCGSVVRVRVDMEEKRLYLTKKLLEKKSEELQVSQNKLTEICLQKYLPKMRLSWS